MVIGKGKQKEKIVVCVANVGDKVVDKVLRSS